jgi:hypothetical protein
MRFVLIAAAVVTLSTPAVADPRASRPAEPPSAEELAAIMKALLTSALPNPLVEQSSNWGHQSTAWNGVTWEKDGILLKPHKQKKLKNDGTWRKIKVEAVDPDKNLNLIVRNVQQPEKGRLTFDLVLALQTRIYFEQQIWKSGVRLYSGSTRARCRPILALKCESTSRAVKTDGALPDVVFRLRVLDARLTYDQFKVEHTAGIGGELADVIGDALHDMIKQLKPSLERDMLEKANRAIVKAGDTKEVKLGLGRLFDGK